MRLKRLILPISCSTRTRSLQSFQGINWDLSLAMLESGMIGTIPLLRAGSRLDLALFPLSVMTPLTATPVSGSASRRGSVNSPRCGRHFDDFAYAVQVFLDPDRLVEVDNRFDYGEQCCRLLGQIEGRLFLVVYTPRGDAFRMISARKANAKEVARYRHSSRDD